VISIVASIVITPARDWREVHRVLAEPRIAEVARHCRRCPAFSARESRVQVPNAGQWG
jgi:hypothetical protein